MKMDYFIDTSVWISFFRDETLEYGEKIDRLIEEDRVHINGIVLAEILTGARNDAEFERLASALSGLKFIPADRSSFLAAGRYGSLLRRKGASVPLSDVIIAADCISRNLILIEKDKHFCTIAEHLPLRREGEKRKSNRA